MRTFHEIQKTYALPKSQDIHDLYDRMFKRILTLSDKTVINLINGLFQTNYPYDSPITYNWTEHEDKELKKTLADGILTIAQTNSYHIEAQMTEDEEIVFRVFEYGFGHAYKNRIMENGMEKMIFPKACVLYLDEGTKDAIPDEYTLILQFHEQGEFVYKVPVIKLQNLSLQELEEKKMICLLPFTMLRFRKKLASARTKENILQLQKLITYDIIYAINKNEAVGNISISDANDLKYLTLQLYMKLYSKYEELEEYTMKLHDEPFEFFSDKMARLEKLDEQLQEKNLMVLQQKDTLLKQEATLKQQNDTLAKQEATLKQQNDTLAKQEATLKQQNDTLAQKDDELAQQKLLIEELQKQISQLQKNE